MTTFEQNYESLNEDAINKNVETLNKYLKRELLELTLQGTELEEIAGRKYQAVILSGIIDNETGRIVSLGRETIDNVEEYRQATFSLRVIAAPIYKNKEEIINDLNSKVKIPPEIIDYTLEEYASPKLGEVLDQTIRRYVIENA